MKRIYFNAENPNFFRISGSVGTRQEAVGFVFIGQSSFPMGLSTSCTMFTKMLVPHTVRTEARTMWIIAAFRALYNDKCK